MSLIRQMPKLIIRGTTASITMPNLTTTEREHVDELVRQISNHPELARHKRKIIEKFGHTIGADYYEDKSTAEAEFNIAIWRGVIELFYHRQYSFKCRGCQQSSYRAKSGRVQQMDRLYLPCPHCDIVMINDAGDSDLVVGSIVSSDEFTQAYINAKVQPKCCSPIECICGPKKYTDPERIINDPAQLRKFFAEFVWNYFRQQIAENIRTSTTNKEPIIGRADWVLAHEISSLCSKFKLEHTFEDESKIFSRYTVHVLGMKAPLEFSVGLMMIIEKAKLYGVVVEASPISIVVFCNNQCGSIVSTVLKTEYAITADGDGSIDSDEDQLVSQVSHRTICGVAMNQDNHTVEVDAREALEWVRDQLPIGDCRRVYDLICQTGVDFDEYSNQYGNGEAKLSHMARFLGCTTQAIKGYKETIKLTMLSTGFIPDAHCGAY